MKPSEPDSFVIGLVGGIGSGKSTVALALACFGAVAVDCDAIAHGCLSRPAVRRALRKLYGEEVFDGKDRLDRVRLARKAFRSRRSVRELEAIIHPLVIERLRGVLRAARRERRVVVIDAPLLLEAGLLTLCDLVVYVRAPAAVRFSRLRKARGWSAAEVRRREGFQMSLQKKAGIADEIIDNSGNPRATIPQIRKLWNRVARLRARRVRPAETGRTP
ncbi:MAG: dephospho-CoA kinase [Planctomycetota bacterium]